MRPFFWLCLKCNIWDASAPPQTKMLADVVLVNVKRIVREAHEKKMK
jgi:hypothetical protein